MKYIKVEEFSLDYVTPRKHGHGHGHGDKTERDTTNLKKLGHGYDKNMIFIFMNLDEFFIATSIFILIFLALNITFLTTKYEYSF